MTTKQKQLYNRIDEILWNDWDPIGINDTEISDEYQGYIPHIFSLVTQNADKIKIAEHLYRLETIDLGLSGNNKRCEEIAKKIIDANR